jgi:hypothetical protein
MALLFSGLIFVLFGRKPVEPSAQQQSFKESQERTAYYLHQMREDRGELTPAPYSAVEHGLLSERRVAAFASLIRHQWSKR